LTLKINALVGIRRAPGALALVVGIESLVALIGNPLVGRLSDRTTSRFGMRRPWMVVGVLGGTGAIFGGVRFGRRASPHNQDYADGDVERQPTASGSVNKSGGWFWPTGSGEFADVLAAVRQRVLLQPGEQCRVHGREACLGLA
jgi:hypothetical protein